jgi:predicted RNA polymerase sigma factor
LSQGEGERGRRHGFRSARVSPPGDLPGRREGEDSGDDVDGNRDQRVPGAAAAAVLDRRPDGRQASDAEDIVQDAFLRFHREARRGTDIASPKAWLSTVTTRLAINHVQSARVRRERYVGSWLPEPIVTDTDPGGGLMQDAETADSLSLAFLVLLESLGPVERAVFLLREVFDYGY